MTVKCDSCKREVSVKEAFRHSQKTWRYPTVAGLWKPPHVVESNFSLCAECTKVDLDEKAWLEVSKEINEG